MKRFSRKFFLVGLFVWAMGGLYWTSQLHASHLLSFKNEISIETLRNHIHDEQSWTLFHTFAPDCACSRFLMEDLLSRKPLPDTAEVVLSLGPLDVADDLRGLGYQVHITSPEELAKEDPSLLRGVPFFVLTRRSGELAYLGGYSENKINPHTSASFHQLVTRLQRGEKIAALPVKGCAVSESYQKLIPKLGFRGVFQ